MRTTKFLAACALGTSLIAGGLAFAPAFAQPAAVEATGSGAETTQAKKDARQGQKRDMKHRRPAEQMKDVDTSQWIGIKDVFDKVEAAGYKEVHSIKRTPKGYFASALDSDGKWTMLSVEPLKGEVKKLERKARTKSKN